MADNFINPQSASYDDIKAAINTWIESQPDYNTWSPFYKSTQGAALINMFSGFAAFLKYDAIMSLRESFMQFAMNRSSVVAGGQFLGYNSFRGRNAVLNITITPTSSGVLTKWQSLGLVKNFDMLVLTPTAYTTGVPVTIQVVLGHVLSETIVAQNDALNSFVFKNPRVSSDIQMFINNTIVGVSGEIQSLLLGSFAVTTNPFGSVTSRYLNLSTFVTRYVTGSEVKLSYVELEDIAFSLSDVEVKQNIGTLTESAVVSFYRGPETTASIQVNAPLDNETKNAIRGREDMPKIYKKLNPSFVDAKGIDISAAVIKVIGLSTDNFYRLNAVERQAAQDAFQPFRMNGLQPPIIGDPSEIPLKLKFLIYLNTNFSGNVQAAVDSVISGFHNKLGNTVNLFDMENSLTEKDFIKICRITIDGSPWSGNTYSQRGAFVLPTTANGFVYQVQEIRYVNGTTEPVWPTVAGQTVSDGQIKWTAVASAYPLDYVLWTASTYRTLNTTVRPSTANGFIYRATEFINKSGAAEPVWPALAGKLPAAIKRSRVNDNELIWVAIPKVGTPAPWSANTNYKVGDEVVAVNQVTSDTVGVMFKAMEYRGKSGGTAPVFPTVAGQTVVDGNQILVCVTPTGPTVTAQKDQYFTITNSVTTTT